MVNTMIRQRNVLIGVLSLKEKNLLLLFFFFFQKKTHHDIYEKNCTFLDEWEQVRKWSTIIQRTCRSILSMSLSLYQKYHMKKIIKSICKNVMSNRRRSTDSSSYNSSDPSGFDNESVRTSRSDSTISSLSAPHNQQTLYGPCW